MATMINNDSTEMFDFDLMKKNIEHENRLRKEKEAREAKTVVPTPVHGKNGKKETEVLKQSLEERLDDLCKGRNKIQMSRPPLLPAAKKRLQAQVLKSIALVKKAGHDKLAN